MRLQRSDDWWTIFLILLMDLEPASPQFDVGEKLGVIVLLIGLEEELDLNRTFGEVARVALQRNTGELCLSAHRLRVYLRVVKLVEHLKKRITVPAGGAVGDDPAISHERHILAE